MNRCLTHLSSHGSYPICFPLLSAGKLAVCFYVDEGHDVFTPVRYKKDKAMRRPETSSCSIVQYRLKDLRLGIPLLKPTTFDLYFSRV